MTMTLYCPFSIKREFHQKFVDKQKKKQKTN